MSQQGGSLGRLDLKFNPARLAWIIDSAVVASTEIVNFHFQSLVRADLSKPAHSADANYQFRAPEMTAAARRAMHENWILSKAFHEILRAVRHALEEAHVLLALLTGKHKAKSSGTLSEFFAPFTGKAAKLKFPELLASVNRHLDPKIDFAEAYMSLQAARNCLEHRAGIISEAETCGAETFILRVPRIKLFYLRQGTEVELVAGHRVDSGDDRAEVDVLMKFESRERPIALGERLTFSLAEFNEIAFACHVLGQQLSTKLPKPRQG